MVIVNIVSALTLLVVIFPLLLISKYNYPTADDWSYGAKGYQVIQSGGGVWELCVATVKNVKEFYISWEGRFCNALFASLQPGIWGEKYYGIVAYLMIGILIFSETIIGHADSLFTVSGRELLLVYRFCKLHICLWVVIAFNCFVY